MLTAVQIEARKGKLTASRIAALMTGDAPAILALWREMVGYDLPEDLTRVWPVALGGATEQINLDWYAAKNNPVTRRGEVVIHKAHDWAAATLDGWDAILRCPIECKHVGGREPVEVIVDRYQPQMQWQMNITAARQCALSVIMGANEPIVEFIPYDDDYAVIMVARGHQFMDFVQRRVPPVDLPAIPVPADATKTYDMTGNNSWANDAVAWVTHRPAFERCRDAEKNLKAIVPEDARKCHGHGVQITRDRAGRLSLRNAT